MGTARQGGQVALLWRDLTDLYDAKKCLQALDGRLAQAEEGRDHGGDAETDHPHGPGMRRAANRFRIWEIGRLGGFGFRVIHCRPLVGSEEIRRFQFQVVGEEVSNPSLLPQEAQHYPTLSLCLHACSM